MSHQTITEIASRSSSARISEIYLFGGICRNTHFKARSTEEGIYHYSGGLLFYNGIADGPPDGALAVNADQHLVVTRDGSTAQVTVYLNSAQKFSFTDIAGHAVLSGPNRILHLLIDDFNATDNPIGFLDQMRIYQGALTAVQVSDLYNGTPPDKLLP